MSGTEGVWIAQQCLTGYHDNPASLGAQTFHKGNLGLGFQPVSCVATETGLHLLDFCPE